ncbi:MAG: hypothetical protein QOJ01_1152 [Solirubrobacterales bacterium]|nr:hypothetical protein [Solirubrobacterales bacterium]
MFDLDEYRRRSESFLEEISREHYRHLAGHKPTLEIDVIYAGYADLFERDAVEELRALPGDDERRARYLLHFAFDGFLGRQTTRQEEELADLEAALEVELDDERVGFRQVAAELANEHDPERRAALEAARNELAATKLDPLHLELLEHAHGVCRELGWAGYADAHASLRGVDFQRLAAKTRAFLKDTDPTYATTVDPELEAVGVPPLGALARSDLPRLFRAEHLDGPFDGERMVPALRQTLAGMGIDLAAQDNVTVDAEARPTKSPRAFCSTPQVPGEVYLVVAPVGGRGDFDALFHEAGHTEHYAHVDAELPFEYRHLGDNAVTESFAFLVEHLVADPAWLGETLGIEDPEPVASHARAAKLMMLRRYAAKLDYELELHAAEPNLDAMPRRYSELLGSATRVQWPQASWLSDVDGGFYVACYLRAWALEMHWRDALRERFGERWYANAAAGDWLRGLWREGQRLSAEELLSETLGEELGFELLTAELG